MPPTKKFSKEAIVDIAYGLVKKEGLSAMNARRIAKELKGSVQPIYHNFGSMKELEKAVTANIYETYREYLKNATDRENPYLAKGLAYIKFAKEYPEFFKIIYMSSSNLKREELVEKDRKTLDDTIGAIDTVFKLDEQDKLDFHTKVWIFTHGIACLVVNKTVDFTDDEIEEILKNTVREMYEGYMMKRGKK